MNKISYLPDELKVLKNAELLFQEIYFIAF